MAVATAHRLAPIPAVDRGDVAGQLGAVGVVGDVQAEGVQFVVRAGAVAVELLT
ncbi:hypothetical protein ACF05F_32235 [Rhodococcus erythropolis]